MADSNLFLLQIISPERIFLEEDVEMVEVTTTEGDIGILKGHIPLTVVTMPGIINIKINREEKKAALHEGFVKILGDKVVILAESCEWPGEIDLNRAQEAKIRAERRMIGSSDNINKIQAEMALRRSLTRIELTKYKH